MDKKAAGTSVANAGVTNRNLQAQKGLYKKKVLVWLNVDTFYEAFIPIYLNFSKLVH